MIESLFFIAAAPRLRAIAVIVLSLTQIVPLTTQTAASTTFVNTLMPQPASLTANTGSGRLTAD
jgi:hypothetical protein